MLWTRKPADQKAWGTKFAAFPTYMGKTAEGRNVWIWLRFYEEQWDGGFFNRRIPDSEMVTEPHRFGSD